MGFPRLRHIPLRLSTGLLILDSGLSKRGADAETAQGLHGMAVGAYPFLADMDMDPQEFVKQLSRAEIALGAALLLPMVPTWLVALGLTAFSGGLVGLYLRTPALHKEGSIRPNQGGLGIAKDVWMFGIGLNLVLDSLTPRRKLVIAPNLGKGHS